MRAIPARVVTLLSIWTGAMETKVTMRLDEIFALVLSVLTANGLSRDQAEAIADIVTRAEADACRSHGLYRVEGYVAGLRAGRVNPTAQPRVRRLRPAMLQVDGDKGFAPFAANLARPHLIAAARENGIAAMAIARTHHFRPSGPIWNRWSRRGWWRGASLWANARSHPMAAARR